MGAQTRPESQAEVVVLSRRLHREQQLQQIQRHLNDRVSEQHLPVEHRLSDELRQPVLSHRERQPQPEHPDTSDDSHLAGTHLHDEPHLSFEKHRESRQETLVQRVKPQLYRQHQELHQHARQPVLQGRLARQYAKRHAAPCAYQPAYQAHEILHMDHVAESHR